MGRAERRREESGERRIPCGDNGQGHGEESGEETGHNKVTAFGVYIYLVEAEKSGYGGLKKTGRFAVVR